MISVSLFNLSCLSGLSTFDSALDFYKCIKQMYSIFAGCDMWHYGDNCTGTCNCLTEPCNTSTGICQGGCKKGWKGTMCNEG